MSIRAVVVDDDLPSARAIGRLLEEAGCTVQICTDPVSAIPAALEAGVDVVTLDIRMPRLDGFEVLSLIRSHEHSRRAPSVPVVAVTGSVTPADRASAIASGFAAHVAKPVALEDLQGMLETVRTLHSEVYRTRYSVDHAAIAGRVDQVLPGATDQAAQAITGLALAIEQQGADLLQRMLLAAFERAFDAATESAARLAGVGETIGAAHLAAQCESFIGSLQRGPSHFERDAVLARAELDRIAYTLRERVLA